MLISLASSLDCRRVVSVVACLKDAGPLASELTRAGITVYSGLLKHKADVFAVPRLAQVFREEQIDAVCAVGSGGDRMFWSSLAASFVGRPCLVWAHLSPTASDPTFEWANQALYRRVDRFIAGGKRHREAMIRIAHVPAGKIDVIRNGIDVAVFDRPDLRRPGRHLLGLDDDRAVAVGIVGNFRAEKRHDVFIESARRLTGRRPRAVFYIIGGGPEERRVRDWAVRSGLGAERLRLMGQPDDVSVLMQGLDIVCLCSDSECQSIVMLEAMAAGRAFVGPNAGSLDEALIDGQTGRFVRPGDADSLTAVLDELIADPQQRARLGESARTKVYAEFTARQMARGFEDLVQSLAVAQRRANGLLTPTRT